MGSTIWIVVAALLAAEPGQISAADLRGSHVSESQTVSTGGPGAEATAREWRATVHDALRREATSHGAARRAALVDLMAVYRGLPGAHKMTEAERNQLRALVRSRLARAADSLRHEKKGADAAPDSIAGEPARIARFPSQEQMVLHQQMPRRGAAGGVGANSPAQELIDLITNTIAPDTWAVNGGLGTIRYFSLGHVLVVRQTAAVHGELGDAIDQLRRN